MHKYKIRYDASIEYREEGFTKDEADEKGLTDALIICSVLYPEDGSLSHLWLSDTGNGKMSSVEIFKAFSSLACMLSKDETLHDWQRYICEEAFNKVCQIITRNND